MGEPRGRFPQSRETRDETHAREIRLDEEDPRVRADVEFDRTPVAYSVEGSIGAEGAWGRLQGRARSGSPVERASAALLALLGTVFPPLALGGLAHVAGAPTTVTLTLAGAVWLLSSLVAFLATRDR